MVVSHADTGPSIEKSLASAQMARMKKYEPNRGIKNRLKGE